MMAGGANKAAVKRTLKWATVVTVPGLAAVTGVWYAWANVVPTADVPTPVMPKVNARDDYGRAIALLKDKDRVGDALSSAVRVRDMERPPVTDAERAALATANAPALDAVRAGFGKPFLNPPARSWAALFPEFAGYRATARAFTLDAQVRAARGDHAGAVRSSLDAMQMGADVPRGGVLIAGLVGIACEAIGRRPVWAWVGKVNADEAHSAAARLERIDQTRFAFADTLREEKWCGQASLLTTFRKQDTLRFAWEMYGDAGLVEGDTDREDWEKTAKRLKFCASVAPYSKRQIFGGYTTYLDAVTAAAEKPYRVAASLPPPPEPRDPINQLLTPVFTMARFKDDAARTENRLLMTVFALRAYRETHGGYPATLDALVSGGYLRRVPVDPFSPQANDPLRYRVAGDRYTLYSVGPDGKDDGGRPADALQGGGPQKRYHLMPEDVGDWVAHVNTADARPAPEN